MSVCMYVTGKSEAGANINTANNGTKDLLRKDHSIYKGRFVVDWKDM